jgi:hypothetical protein
VRCLRACTIAISAALVVGAAEAPTLDLTWTAPATCPDRTYVVDEVARLLGNVHAKDDVRVRAMGTVVAKDGALQLELELRVEAGASWTRTLSASDCKVLADSAAVILALTVNPSRAEAAATPSPSVSAPSATIAAIVPTTMPPIVVAPTPIAAPAATDAPVTKRNDVYVAVAPRLDLGTAPMAMFGARASIGTTIGGAYGDIAFGGAPEHTTAIEARPGARAAFSSVSVTPRVGVRLGERAALGGLLGIDLSRITARGLDIRSPAESGVTRTSATATLLATLPITSWLSVFGDATVLFPFNRARYRIDVVDVGAVEVHRTPALVGHISIGLELRL